MGKPWLGGGDFTNAALSFSESIFLSLEGVRAPVTSAANGSGLPSLTDGLYSTVGGGGEGEEPAPVCGVLDPTAYGGELK